MPYVTPPVDKVPLASRSCEFQALEVRANSKPKTRNPKPRVGDLFDRLGPKRMANPSPKQWVRLILDLTTHFYPGVLVPLREFEAEAKQAGYL